MSTQPTTSDLPIHPRLAEKTVLGRRQFLASSVGGFLLSFVVGAERKADAQTAVTNTAINSYIQIGSDNSVTIMFGGCELGQGSMTGLAQCAAEDLMVDWSAVKILTAPNSAISYGTGGSSAIRFYSNVWRTAGATARQMLISAAASIWGVDSSLCTAAHGAVTYNGNTLTYGQLAATAASLPVPLNPPLIGPANFRIIGQPIQRADIPSKVDGSAIFGIDVMVPGMLFAAIKHCPTIGGVLAKIPSVPSGATAVVPVATPDSRGGVVANSINAVAVVAATTWAAKQAAQQLNVKWTLPANASTISSAAYSTQMQALLASASPAGLVAAETVGNAPAAINSPTNAQLIDVTYTVPYCAHATLEPLSCTASVDLVHNTCEVWAPTQSAATSAAYAAAASGVPLANIIVHTTFLGGGLGRKFEQDFVSQAVQVSKALGKPVKLTWPREEDFAHDQYRPMAMVRVRATLDSSNNVTAFWARNVSQSILDQRGWLVPGTVDSQATEGATALRYNFGSRLTDWIPFNGLVPVGFWRSVGVSINAFAVESAIDELAVLAKIDPFTFRKQLLAGDSRASALMQAADIASSWRNSLATGHAYGVAFAESFGTLVCHVVDVSSQTSTVKSGTTTTTVASAKVNRVATIVDCGFAVNPNQVEAQMQGGLVHGMGAALWSSVSFTNGVASVNNFNNYRLVRSADMPQVTVTIVNSDANSNPTGGIGEPAVPPVAPAIANAWFRLTGQRLRSLPMFPSLSSMGGD